MMGNKIIEVFQGKRSDYYAAIASVSLSESLTRIEIPQKRI